MIVQVESLSETTTAMKIVVLMSLFCVASAETFKDKMVNAFMGDADIATVEELTNDGKAVKVESCGADTDALKIQSAKFDSKKFTLTVIGDLQRQLVGGHVSANISLGSSPVDATWKEKMARSFAFHMSRHNHNEPLCTNLERSARRHDLTDSACPVQSGGQTLHFSLHRLPLAVAAGDYKFIVNAKDELGSVVCLQGVFAVQRGAAGQLFRKLQEASSAHGLLAGLLPLLFMTVAHI